MRYLDIGEMDKDKNFHYYSNHGLSFIRNHCFFFFPV